MYTQERIEELPRENFAAAIIFGLMAAIITAILWGIITVSTGYQIGYMAIAVGFAVGYAIRLFGKGRSTVFGITGAILAFLGCILGNFLSIIGFISIEYDISYIDTLNIVLSDMSIIPELMQETFHPMDIVFYLIAISAGFRYSISPTNSANNDDNDTSSISKNGEAEEKLENRE